MGSEKSATQTGYVAAALGVDSTGMKNGVGVRGSRGITDGGKVHVATGELADCGVERTFPIPHARATTIIIAEKNKDFEYFVFISPTGIYLTTGFKVG